MGRRKTLNDDGVAALKTRAKRYAHPDPELPSHYIRVQPSGAKSFVVVNRKPDGKQLWHTIGSTAAYSIDEARERARKIIRALREGDAPPDSFGGVAETWREQYAVRKGLRSLSEIDRFLVRLKAEWVGRDFETIRRADVTKLLDKIAKNHGARQADYALAVFRQIANWHATRTDDYVSPVVKGMRRTNPKETQRKRKLDDDELRAVWKQAEANGTFGALIRLLLLTGQRRAKVAAMRWDDIVDGVWRIPSEDREKGNAVELVLPAAARRIIKAQPRYAENPYVLAGRGKSHFCGYSAAKSEFDKKVPIAHWQLHDLRRTARSLMSRAGVPSDIAERVLGHAQEGVEAVYDRHEYRDEKAAALKKLAGLVGRIVRLKS